MNGRVYLYRLSAGVALASLSLFVARTASAQEQTSDAFSIQQKATAKRAEVLKKAQALPTPRLPDGHPDFSGVWAGGAGTVTTNETGGKSIYSPSASAPKSVDPNGTYNRIYETLEGNQRREANPNKPVYKADFLEKVKELDLNENQEDPIMTCHPAGVPRAFPDQIFAVPGYMVLFFMGENGNHYRVIRTDGSAHPKNLTPSYYGDSVGHWEGDTLVVDVVGFNDKTWLGSSGWFHSTAMHVVERYSRQGNVLNYQATVEDSVLAKPWVTTPRLSLLNTDPNNNVYEEYPCMDFDQAHLVNHDHN